MSSSAITSQISRKRQDRKNKRKWFRQTQSINTLADDNNNIKSSKGLKSFKPSPFEPVIHNHDPFVPIREPAGAFTHRAFKRVENPQRQPLKPTEYNPFNSIPHKPAKRSLSISQMSTFAPKLLQGLTYGASI
jgi:hypothetical protein